jgi:hypothetical protein
MGDDIAGLEEYIPRSRSCLIEATRRGWDGSMEHARRRGGRSDWQGDGTCRIVEP